jgi:glycosyltransferase involved in cell wall biosynthesis/2-polyprenyl-3-methyl-5-hydroxy-6-metoxy-1,4-benzoquinol methylase
MLKFTGERIVPEADNCEPLFAGKMYQEHLARYLFASQVCVGKRVLDVGCGVGYGAHLLARRGAAQVTAFDISEDAVQHALEFYAHPRIEYVVASAEDFSIPGPFDVVTCFELIEHLNHQHRAVERIASLLAGDGLLIMSTPRPLGPKRSAFHTRELNLHDFTGLLSTYFKHFELFFENNHFASLVTSEEPRVIEAVHALHPQFNLGQADYLVAVASQSAINVRLFQPQLVLNDERYIKNLERDVDILHRAEADLQARISSFTQENADLRAHAEERETELRDLMTRNSDFRSRVDAKDAEAQALMADNANLRGLLEKSEAALQALAEEDARLKARLETNEVEVAALAKDNSDLRVQVGERDAQVEGLAKENSDLRVQVGERDAQVEGLAKDNADLRVQVGEREAEIQALTKDNSELRVRVQKGEADCQAQVSRLSAERAVLRKQVDTGEESRRVESGRLAAESAGLRARLSAREREIQSARDENAALRGELNAMDALRASLQYEVAFWQQSVTRQKLLVESLRHNVDALYRSASWRITAPLRSGLDLLLAAQRLWHRKDQFPKQLPPPIQDAPAPEPQPAAVHDALKAAPACEFLGKSRFDVVYVIGCHEGESKRYRAHNLAEGLNELGYTAAAIPDSDAAALIRSGVPVKVVVLFRSGDTQPARDLIASCRDRGVEIAFDIDDLVFEPESVEFVRVVKGFSAPERAEYLRGVEQYRTMLLAADYVTCPTRFLAERAERLGKRALVIPNSLNLRQIELARRLPARSKGAEGTIRLGYFSGSNTHQVDFQECEDALLSLMERHPECRFVLAGVLDLGSRWERFKDRVERHPYMPYEKMLEVLALIDVNLAPLELGNPYCDGKSQLKIFEAGLVGVPTIASPTESYRDAIDHGDDGCLAASYAEWLESLERLVTDAELRARMGANARERALRQFGPEAAAAAAADAYGFTGMSAATLTNAETGRNNRIKISWIVPGLIIGGGGHRNILRAAYYLERFGHEVDLYFTNTEMTERQLAEAIRTHFYPLECRVHCYRGSIQPTDVLFATHWSTVDAAVRAKDVAGELMYFVQDFEPAFAPMGTEYVLAENTYRLGLYHITSGPWCEHVLKREFGCDADHFLFPVDRAVYHPRPRIKSEKNLIFFAKPEMPRRCFELGTMALEEFHRLRPDVEIILFGSKHVEGKRLPFPATIHSLLPTIDDLAALYSNADIGIVFSTTNPSLVPYEMMACGLPVVDLGRPGNEINYNGRQDIALLADPAPAAMARQIRELLENSNERAARSRRGLEFVDGFPSEEQMARRVESLILARLKAKSSRGELSGLSAHA